MLNMKKIAFTLIAISAVTIISCKKKEKDPEPIPATTTTPTNNYDGLLYSQELAIVNSGTIGFTTGNSSAVFPSGGFYNSSSISDGFIGTAVNAGTISVNSVVMKPTTQSSGILYDDTTYAVHTTPLAWTVSGGSGIPTFNYTYTATKPSYTGWTSLQDTIKRSQNTTVPLTGITGADEILVYIMSGSGMASKVLTGTSTNVVFTVSELSGLSASTSASIWVSCTKSSIVSLGGKNIKFKAGYGIIKTIVVQ